MAEFSHTFTGRGTAVVLPESSALKAQEKLSDIITKANELRYQTFRENRDRFLKNVEIDPLFVLSDSARKFQMKLIEDFNKKWGKRAQETNYNLSITDQQNILTDKNFIIATANQQKAEMDLFLQHRDLVSKNPNRYDLEKFNQATQDYMQNGIYNQTMPSLKSIPFGSFIREQASKMKGEYNAIPVYKGGQVSMATRNIQDIPRFIEQNLFVNDQATIGLLEDWEKEPDKEKWLIDIDKNNQIDPSEQKNAIIEWAKQKYVKDAEILNYSTWKNLKSIKETTGAFNWNLDIGPDNNRNNQFDIQGSKTVETKSGDITVADFMPISTVNPASVYMTINKTIKFDKEGRRSEEILGIDKETPRGKSSSVSVEILGYSPSSDLLFVRATSYGGDIFTGDILALNAAEYDQYLRGKPFGIDRTSLRQGRTMTEGTYVTPNIRNQPQETTKTIGGIKFETTEPKSKGKLY